MAYRIIQSDNQSFSYNGNLMTNADGNTLDYDENGNMTENASAKSLEYNWDNKLRSFKDGNYVKLALKYDPAGNRIYRETSNGSTKRKYIVDIVASPEHSRGSDLPTILMEINPISGSTARTYIYANSQILMQHSGSFAAPKYFYLSDRLGSVREAIDTTGDVIAHLTYNPFGETLESSGPFVVVTSFRFAGQYYDIETGQYYLRARQYDPYIGRFTSRDPIEGKFEESLSLHKYLYCQNDPTNRIDPMGLLYTPISDTYHYDIRWTQHIIDTATEFVLEHGYAGMLLAFGPYGDPFDERYPGRGLFDYAGLGFTFEVAGCEGRKGGGVLEDGEFGNYLAGYLAYHVGWMAESYTRLAGHAYSIDRGEGLDSWSSRYLITKGALDANTKMIQQIRDKINGRSDGLVNRMKNFFDECDLGSLRADSRRLQWEVNYYNAERIYEELTK